MASESLFSGLEVLDIAKGPVRLVSAPSVDNWHVARRPNCTDPAERHRRQCGRHRLSGLGGLFIAHVTGNLVILAAHIAADDEARLANIISFPVFIIALAV